MILLALLNTLMPAVVVAAVAWTVLRISRVNAATRYWAWWGVIAAVLALPFWPVPQETMIEMGDLPPLAPVEVAPETNWLVWVAFAWAAFALYRMTRLAFSYASLRSIRNNARAAESTRLDELRSICGVNRATRLLVSSEIASPIAVGFLHPAVILTETLPDKLTPAELDHVLLHELAHVARYDDWANLAARFAGALLGIHPVIAFALTRIEKERELACDDWVVSATGEARPYAASLTRIFELSRGYDPQPLASGITGSRLGDRVEQLLTHGRRFTRDASIAAMIVMAAALVVMVVVGSQSPDWVAFAQERPVPPLPPNAPAAPNPPVVPIPLAVPPPRPVPPVAPEVPVAPVAPIPPTPPAIDLRDREAQRNLALQALQAQLRARQAQMLAERNRLLETEESLRAREAVLKAELEALQRQLEEFRRANQF